MKKSSKGRKFTQPIKRDLCWICDKQLYAGGRTYAEIEVGGVKRPVHQFCAEQAKEANRG